MTVTAEQVADWVGVKEFDADSIIGQQIAAALAAVEGKIEDRYLLPTVPTAGQLAAWDQAVKMAAARVYSRKRTPEGMQAFEGIGAIRITASDADVDDLFGNFRVFNFG